MKILVANGVNLDLLGSREPEIYGVNTLEDMKNLLLANVSGVSFEFFQSNSESQFIEKISSSYDGIILNPGAWTHTSIAILDRILAVEVPYIEVHISNIFSREDFRSKSYYSSSSLGVVSGLGIDSYLYAALYLKKYLIKNGVK